MHIVAKYALDDDIVKLLRIFAQQSLEVINKFG